MDVYLVPVGAARYELYCEVPDEPHDAADEPPRGVFRRMAHRFREMLAEAERERRGGSVTVQRGRLGRLRARVLRWVAESIAEQRLLWHLRRQSDACLHYPDDMNGAEAVRLLRQQLTRDFDRHRFWLAIDSLLMVGSAALILVPGPNVLGYYFAFRCVGHFFSVRGARRGLSIVKWRHEPSAPLSELRRALTLAPEMRERQVQDVALRLRLEHLPTFVARMVA